MPVSICAVSTETESGDKDVHLIHYSCYKDTADFIFDRMGDEMAYISEICVDSGSSLSEDEAIEEAILQRIAVLNREG